MKVLYGIQATGNGHLARARVLVPELRRAGIECDIVFSGRAKEDFFNMQVFDNPVTNVADYRCFQGITLMTKNGKLQPFNTFKNINVFRFLHDAKQLDLSGYDLVISDFEPVSAWAAIFQRKTSIAISHQSAFSFNVPKVTGHLLSRFIMRVFAPCKYRIGLHWDSFNQNILPPIIEQQQLKSQDDNKILIYMGFENIDDIIEFVRPFSSHQFIIYAKVEQLQEIDHITVKPLCHKGFHEDLSDASGVISNAGFELSSECLSLGKKLLIKPLKGQYEQLCNALALEEMDKATIMHSFNSGLLQKWLTFNSQTPQHYPNVARAIAEWLKKQNLDDSSVLTKQLWSE